MTDATNHELPTRDGVHWRSATPHRMQGWPA